jgi:hypothetical protein
MQVTHLTILCLVGKLFIVLFTRYSKDKQQKVQKVVFETMI